MDEIKRLEDKIDRLDKRIAEAAEIAAHAEVAGDMERLQAVGPLERGP
jgi:cell division septum initiation protein DivIVA